MAAQKGPALLVKQGDGETVETFATLAGVRSKSISAGAERIDTTTDDNVALDSVTHRTYTPGITDFAIDVSGITKGATETQRLINDGRQGTVRNYQVVFPTVGQWAGPMFLSDFNISAEYEGVIEFSATLSSNAAVDWTPETSAPVNVVLPAIAGIPQQGVALTASVGSWTGAGLSFAFQWQVDVAGNGTFGNVSGATSQSYTPVAGDVTDRVRVIVTATNSHSSVSATSAPTIPVIGA